MKHPRNVSRLAACGLAIALTGMSPPLQANPVAPAYLYIPFLMGDYGMGPGWGGYGMGPGWGGYGMGPAQGGDGMRSMMGVPGMGRMMGGGGMGPNRASGPVLTEEQKARINAIHDETRKVHCALIGELINQQAKLRDLNNALNPDKDAIEATATEIGNLQQRMVDTAMEAHKQMRAVLTEEAAK